MQHPALIGRLRQALAAADLAGALQLLAELRRQRYPQALLRPVLAAAHPGLDPAYLDLALLPPAVLLAPRIPEALDRLPFDPLRLQLAHGCAGASFLAASLPAVLRGERPLYAGLPALDLRYYYQLLQLTPDGRSRLRRASALECLAAEPCAQPAAAAAQHGDAGGSSCSSALQRWAPSSHDALLERPWMPLQPLLDLEQAEALAVDAARRLLAGGAIYWLASGDSAPPAEWWPLLRGLIARRPGPFWQLAAGREGPLERLPLRPGDGPFLLAVDAAWIACRQPRQLLSWWRHWQEGPPLLSKPRIAAELVARRQPLQATVPQGVLLLAATQAQIERKGLEALQRRALEQAIAGGFEQGLVWPLQDPPALLGNLPAAPGTVLAWIGAEDEVAPGSWPLLAAELAWDPPQLICSDEELLWCQQPRRLGQRQFAGSVTPFRLLSRGHLPGLVALPLCALQNLQLQPAYTSLHALLKDLGLQWLEGGGRITTLPQALLRRAPAANPSLLPISGPDQRRLFSAEQLLELEQLSRRRAAAWLHPQGHLEAALHPGAFHLRYSPGAGDRVSVIIPFRDQAALTRACVLSLLEQAGPTPLELLLVDNGSTEAEAIALASELAPLAAARGIPLIGLRDDAPFNFAAINNRARRHCNGSFLLFLNNDIRFASPRPIEALLDPFALASTGAVSARLLYEDGTIQHQGLAAAPRQPHDILSPGKGLRPGLETASFAALELPEQWSAATAACLLMRSADFDRLGGFDEAFVVAYNDVDLCWRLTAAGRAVIVTPEPQIIHAESKSRGDDIAGEKRNRLARESGELRRRYPRRFQQGDPLYHRFLGPASHRFEPMPLPPQPLGLSRDRLVFSWIRPGFCGSAQRPFLIYVHWDAEPVVRPDVLEQLRAYQRYADLAFVSATPALAAAPEPLAVLQQLCAVVLVRENEGYDFGSWQAGLAFCRRFLTRVPRLILANDSCYGPLHDPAVLFERLAASGADVVGLTESTALRAHLQSYFVAYGPRLLRTPLFWTFWQQIQLWGSKLDLVRAYEVGWSGVLADAGFRLEALYLAGQHGNVTHTHWRQLLEELQFPFLKTELLRLNPIRQDIQAWPEVAARCQPRVTRLIQDHLRAQASAAGQREQSG